MRWIRRAAVVAAFAAAGVLATSEAIAGKPGGGGGGGTIDKVYYSTGSQAHRVSSDGTGHETLMAANSNAHPSYRLHGGKRWFLVKQLTSGETNLRGQTQIDLYAVREDGLSVRLTSDPAFNARGVWRFGRDEDGSSVTIFGPARRFASDGSSIAGSGGLYFATVTFDGSGSATGLSGGPTFIASVGIRSSGDEEPNVFRAQDVTPDMTTVVLDSYEPGNDIRLLDIATGTITTVLQTSGHSIDDVTFLSDGNKILFARQDSSLYSYIEKISLDGSGRAVIVKSQRNVFIALPSSSPDSAMLVYTDYGSSNLNPSVYKVSVNGGPKTNLASGYTLGWRMP
jgi:hypothetical protein